MVENQTITINITMITKDKITEIFCIADDFCKEFELETDKIGLSQSQPASAKLQKVFKELTLWSRKV